MNPLEILKREHEAVRKYIADLEEMTYSVSVNVRDFSSLFRELVKFWDQHEKKEELLFEVLADEGYKIPVESMKFEHGNLQEYSKLILKAIKKGEDEKIKEVLHGICGELIDLARAHVLAEDSLLEDIPWEKLSKEALERIELLQIIPDKRLLG